MDPALSSPFHRLSTVTCSPFNATLASTSSLLTPTKAARSPSSSYTYTQARHGRPITGEEGKGRRSKVGMRPDMTVIVINVSC